MCQFAFCYTLEMIARAGLVVALAACGRTPVPDRDDVLAKIPASASVVIAAEGRALAHGRIRPLVDALRPELPTALGCVIDAALASDRVAVGIGADRSLTIALATRAPIKCPALSKLGDGVWVATLGDGLVRGDGVSVAGDPRHARARPYLARAPIAVAAQWPEGKLLATAQPQPLEAWLAIDGDAASVAAIEARVREQVQQLAREPATAPFSRIAVVRTGTQVRATLASAPVGDLGVAFKAVLARGRARESSPALACPAPPVPPVVECKALAFRVPRRAAAPEPVLVAVVANGMLAGFRLREPLASLGLATGDVIVAVDGKVVTSLASIRAAFARAATFTVRRRTSETVVRLVRSDNPLP